MAELPAHGSFPQRGQDAPGRNRNVEGRFGFMFKDLKPFSPPDELLRSLAATMRQAFDPSNPAAFDNPSIPAG